MLQKIHLKILDKYNQQRWVHFCYIAEDVKKRFAQHCPKMSINTKIRHWACEDFGDTLLVDENDLRLLKLLIKSKYQHKYPELVRETYNKTDRQGWLAIWVTEHLNREIIKEITRCL